MVKTCKYPDEVCGDRFYSGGRDRHMCRLTEWKKKLKVCPYDSEIKSCSKRDKGQEEL